MPHTKKCLSTKVKKNKLKILSIYFCYVHLFSLFISSTTVHKKKLFVVKTTETILLLRYNNHIF